jgi:dTDP-4-dehydrorhamnose reductase
MKIAIIGSNGQLGTDLVDVLSKEHEVIGLTHADVDITQMNDVKRLFETIKPDAVLNTAAAHNVPKCEQEPAHAFAVNGEASLNLALLSAAQKFMLVQYSTDYVFDGSKKAPYIESDTTNPLNVYGVTKRAGENFVLNYTDLGYVVRVSGIYGKVPCRAKGGSNFITTMIKLSKEKPEVKVVNDEILTPTSTIDIAANTKLILEQRPSSGVYHMTNEGACSWYEFAREIFTQLDLKTPLYETSVTTMSVPVKRPFYSVLDNMRLREVGMNIMPDWKHSLHNFLRSNYQ